MKDDSFKDAKTDFDKKECNKPENAGKCDQKSEKRFRFSQSKLVGKVGKNLMRKH